MKILVIEDEYSIRTVIVEILQFEKFETISAENGRVGVELARTHRPDLIICDVTMPELDGHGVLKTLRSDPLTESTPFIFLTAKAEKVDVRQGMELGADDYLFKPIGREELLKAIHTRLDKLGMLRQRYEKKIEDLRRNLSTAMPHELRTPLNGILGLSELILDNYESLQLTDIVDMVNKIHQSAHRLHRLVENFWMYAKLEIQATDTGKRKAMQMEATFSSKPVISRIATLRAQEANRESDLHLELQDSTIWISESFLIKVVGEIVENAFKYSSPGTPVQVTGTLEGSSYILKVREEGRGMTPLQISDVGAYMQFERGFYEQQGAGLGLTIAKRLVELHSGSLTIESTPGKETCVQIILPAVAAPLSD